MDQKISWLNPDPKSLDQFDIKTVHEQVNQPITIDNVLNEPITIENVINT